MPNITVTINGGFSIFWRTGYSGNGSYSFYYTGDWFLYKDGQFATPEQKALCSFQVVNFRLDRVEEGDVQSGYGNEYGYHYKRPVYKYEAIITYPDDWVNVSVTHNFKDADYYNPSYPNQTPTQQTLKSVSPIIRFNHNLTGPYYLSNNFRVWPTVGSVDENGLVSYPVMDTFTAYNLTTQTYEEISTLPNYAEGQQNKSEVNAVLTHLLWDWGNGTVDTIPLAETQRVTGSTYVPANDGSGTGQYVPSDWVSIGNITAPVTHTYHPDENGDGTGTPIKLIAVDSVGRKSAPVFSQVGPHLEVNKSIDETRNRIVLDTRGSYGRTGRITTNIYRGDANYEENLLAPDDELDESGRVWSVPLDLAGAHPHYAYVKDDADFAGVGYSAFEPDILNQRTGGRDDYRFEQLKWQTERPPQSALPLPDGATLLATEYEKAIEPPYIDDDTPRGAYTFRGQTMLRFILDNKGAAPEFEDATAPRLFRDGATLYLAGRAESGATKLWRSQIRAKTWSEMSTIWTPDFYHADVVGLIGGGAASIALKRVPKPGDRYDVEFWFRKTFDLSNWESEPTNLDTEGNFGFNLNHTLEETLAFYPILINEALAGRAQRLVAILGSFYSYRSADLGATWEPFV